MRTSALFDAKNFGFFGQERPLWMPLTHFTLATPKQHPITETFHQPLTHSALFTGKTDEKTTFLI